MPARPQATEGAAPAEAVGETEGGEATAEGQETAAEGQETAAEGQETAAGGALDSDALCGATDESRAQITGRLNRDTTEFEVPGGLTVILKRTPGNPVVAIRLFIAGGSRWTTWENAGIAQLTLDVATSGGTEELTKPAFAARLNALGSSIGYSANFDYDALTMDSLAVFLDETWPLFRGVLEQPAFPEEEVALARERQLQSIASREDSPDTYIVDVARALIFEGHPYANRPIGTTESVSRLTRDDLVAYHQQLLNVPSRVLVVVGDVTQEQVVAMIGDTFAGGAAGSPPPPVPPLDAEGPRFEVVESAIPTNYILGLAPAPPPGHEDYPALLLASRHLRDRLFEEVRTKRNLTYAVSAGLSSRLANYVNLYVTAVDPAATLPVMFEEVARLRDQPLTDKELTDLIAVFVTDYYSGLDSNGALAGKLGWWHLLGGGRENADRLIERISQVTAEDIQRVSQTYLTDFQFGVLGDPTAVSLELFSEAEGEEPAEP